MHGGGPAHGGRLGARAQRRRDGLCLGRRRRRARRAAGAAGRRPGLVGLCCTRALRRPARSLGRAAARIPRATAGA